MIETGQEEVSEVDSLHCWNCTNSISVEARFCNHCGSLQLSEAGLPADEQKSYVTWLIAFFVIDLICCLTSHFMDGYDFTSMLVCDAIMLINTAIFCFALRRDIGRILQWKSFSIGKLVLYSLLAVIGSIAVQISVTQINQVLFHRDYHFYPLFLTTDYPFTYMLLCVAVLPAFVEEFGYRGFLISGLEKIIDPKQAMYIASFAFAIMHLSFISFFWLLPFAFLLGRIRQKENTIWYGVVIHFIFNATACLWERYADLF